MKVGILGVGLLSAGLDGWMKGRAVLAGTSSYRPGSVPEPESPLLPATNVAAATPCAGLCMSQTKLSVSQDFTQESPPCLPLPAGNGCLGSVVSRLNHTDRALSPTLFHQSVHNTRAGYWGIATGCQQSSTALSSYDDSSALGLLEAVAYATVEERPVLLWPMTCRRPTARSRTADPICLRGGAGDDPIGKRGSSSCRPYAREHQQGRDHRMEDQTLEELRCGNPAARLLPLLRALAQPGSHRASLNVLDHQRLIVEIES